MNVQTAAAAPFISEVLLPASGGTAVEIDGLDSAGATLLIVNASRERLQVQHAIPLPPAEQTANGLGLSLVVGSDGLASNPTTALPAGSVSRDHPLFSDELPVALVLVQGLGPIGEEVSLGNGGAVSGITAQTPIVDWLSFAAGTNAEAELVIQDPNPSAIAALGIADLPRPQIGTTGITALARALTADGPVMHTLLPGSNNIVDADALGLSDFQLSPGLRNPLATEDLPGDDAALPEPSVAFLLVLGLLGLSLRRRHHGSIAASAGPADCLVRRAGL
ncbi:MAG: PEP-CTERM sorting domain-containing protein [Planctomycetota bacterium]